VSAVGLDLGEKVIVFGSGYNLGEKKFQLERGTESLGLREIVRNKKIKIGLKKRLQSD